MPSNDKLALLSPADNAHEVDGVRALKRCDIEIAEVSSQNGLAAWIVALCVEDWEMEKRLIEAAL
jgi:hypothetical protein